MEKGLKISTFETPSINSATDEGKIFNNLQYLAYEYAKRGACLTLAARRDRSLNEVAEGARELGSPDVITIQADVSKAEDCRRIVDQTMSHFGRRQF